jgi:hypothetical protein
MAPAPDSMDPVLAELRRDIANTLLVLNIVVALGSNHPQLWQFLRGMLGELSQQIAAFLPAIPEEDDGP